MPFAPFIFLICLVAGIAYLICVKRKERELIEQVTPITRGEWSERRVVLKLLKAGINPKAIFHDLYIQKPNGTYTQVDVAVATKVGLIVFEVKDYSGWIFGNEEQEHWTQCLRGKFHTTQKYSFYNPLRQNETHICALMELLKDDTVPYYSYVVFGNNCELKNIQLTSGKHHVTYALYLRRDIEYNARCTGTQLSDEKIDALYAILVNFTEASGWQKDAHIRDVQAKQYPVVQADGTWTCPRCGGQLVMRVAQRGNHAGQTFWGCSNYPCCHFTYQE